MSRSPSRFAAVAVSAGLVAGLAALPAGAAAQQNSTQDLALQKAIVKFDSDVTDVHLDALASLGVQKGFEVRSIDAVAVTALPSVISRLAEVPGVVAVQPQRKLELHLYASKEQIKANGITEPATYERGGGSFELAGYDGTGITVGVIDSGIFAGHPGLLGRVNTGLNFEFTEVQDQGLFTVEEWDQYAEATGPSALQDEVGHGTHVAGTIGGTGAGAMTYTEQELAGIAPAVEMVSLKIASAGNGVFDDFGFEENALFAIDYLIRHPELGVTITNNSWGLLPTEPETIPLEETDYDAANEMVDAAAAAGITMVFAAGNDGPDPASIRPGPGAGDAILVAAACKSVDNTDEACLEGAAITSFSSRGNADGSGPQVDVTAPGETILAPASPSILIPLTRCPTRYAEEPAYYCLSGTSMASPHVAGVVALMQQANPALTPAQAELCLVQTADDMLDDGFDIHSGFGMVDTPEAIACALGVTASQDIAPDAAPEPVPAPEPESDTDALPTTGGGVVVLGLLSLAGARVLRRR